MTVRVRSVSWETMGLKFALCRPDGELFGEAEYSEHPNVGDELIISGNRRVRVLASVPFRPVSNALAGLAE
jgi:hypothetical protein